MRRRQRGEYSSSLGAGALISRRDRAHPPCPALARRHVYDPAHTLRCAARRRRPRCPLSAGAAPAAARHDRHRRSRPVSGCGCLRSSQLDAPRALSAIPVVTVADRKSDFDLTRLCGASHRRVKSRWRIEAAPPLIARDDEQSPSREGLCAFRAIRRDCRAAAGPEGAYLPLIHLPWPDTDVGRPRASALRALSQRGARHSRRTRCLEILSLT
jgi:hypothetical protein